MAARTGTVSDTRVLLVQKEEGTMQELYHPVFLMLPLHIKAAVQARDPMLLAVLFLLELVSTTQHAVLYHPGSFMARKEVGRVFANASLPRRWGPKYGEVLFFMELISTSFHARQHHPGAHIAKCPLRKELIASAFGAAVALTLRLAPEEK